MALIQCDECKREISDRAKACPGCGAPVARPVAVPVDQPIANPASKPKLPVETPVKKPPSSSKLLDPRANLRTLIVAVVVALAGWAVYSVYIHMRLASDRTQPNSQRRGLAHSTKRPRTILEAAAAAARDPKVLVDSDWVIGAGGKRWYEFTLSSPRRFSFEVSGVRSTKKGFSVYRVAGGEIAKLKSKKFRYQTDFSAERVRRFSKTGVVPAGRNAFVVRNSHNLMKAMTVRVKIVADPAE